MQPDVREAVILLMGATGSGKSTFINLLTGDTDIRVGHSLESTTGGVNTSMYVPEEARALVTLVDTPGFDDSHEGVSDTDVLGKIADFMQEDGGRRINGIIYLHRITDPRFSGVAKKNLKIFRELCGDDKLAHVRIITTFWNVISEDVGKDRQVALAKGVFKPFTDAGAILLTHDNGLESAKKIISDLVRQTPVKIKIQEELSAGMALGDTSAGAVVIEEMKGLQKRHEKEMAELRKELEEAENENDEDLRAELDRDRRKLEERIAQVEKDRKKLAAVRVAAARSRQRTMSADRTSTTTPGLNGKHIKDKQSTAIFSAPPPLEHHERQEMKEETQNIWKPSVRDLAAWFMRQEQMEGNATNYTTKGADPKPMVEVNNRMVTSGQGELWWEKAKLDKAKEMSQKGMGLPEGIMRPPRQT